MEINKKYIQPETMIHDFLSSEDVMGIGIGDGSTPDQFGKESKIIDDTETLNQEDFSASVWDD